MGKEQEKPISEAGPGDIVAVAKLKETKTGDTLCSPDSKIVFKASAPLDGCVVICHCPQDPGR